jgi:GH24 family phage-related lysozyme (muramidase)
MESLLKYNKGGGVVLKGLDNRRKDEKALFLKA